jgi:hypothetical protein
MFIIPCKYDKEKSQIRECVASLRLHHPKEKIVIVDSFSHDMSYINDISNIPNVIICDKQNSNYIVGALWKAYEMFPDEHHYVLLHDSATIKKPLNKFLDNEESYSFLYFIQEPQVADQPVIDRFVGPHYKHTPGYPMLGIFGTMCIIKSGLMKKFIANNLHQTFLPINKSECMVSERAMGVLFILEGTDIIQNCVEQKDFLSHLHTMHNDGFEYIKKTIVSRQ